MLSPCMTIVHLLAGRHSAGPGGGRGDLQDHIHHKDHLRGLQSADCTYLWPQPMQRGLQCQAVVLETHLHHASLSVTILVVMSHCSLRIHMHR